MPDCGSEVGLRQQRRDAVVTLGFLASEVGKVRVEKVLEGTQFF